MALKEPDPKTQRGLASLPEDVRNKMGYAKKGGSAKFIQSAIKKPGALRASMGVKKARRSLLKSLLQPLRSLARWVNVQD